MLILQEIEWVLPEKRNSLEPDEIRSLCPHIADELIDSRVFLSRAKHITQERIKREISKSAKKHYSGIKNVQLGLDDKEGLSMTKVYGEDAKNIKEFLQVLLDEYSNGTKRQFVRTIDPIRPTVKVRLEIVRPIDNYLGEYFANKLKKLGYSVISTGWSGLYNVSWAN